VSSSNSLPLFRSLTSSLESLVESLLGDRDLLLRAGLCSRGALSLSDMGRDLPAARSLPLASLSLSRSLSGRRVVGDRDRLGRVTPRSTTLPRSLRSSPWPQLSFIATYREEDVVENSLL
jgi:hypothetical protein